MRGIEVKTLLCEDACLYLSLYCCMAIIAALQFVEHEIAG